MPAVHTVLVVGSGLAGTAAAIHLADHGVTVDLIEIKPDIAAIGSGITLQGNALRELRKLGVWEAVQANGYSYDSLGLRAPNPDGTLLAYQSDEAGRWDVYVQRLADGRRTIVSTNGGDLPSWTPDGSSIVFRAGSSLLRAQVQADTLTVRAAERVGEAGTARPIGIAPDGRVLLDRGSVDEQTTAVIALNWEQEIRRLLGPPSARMPR